MKNFPQIVLFSQLIASCRLWFQMTPTMSGLLEAIGRVNNNGRSRGERLKKGERGSSERGSTRGKRERAQVEGSAGGWRTQHLPPFTVLQGRERNPQSKNPDLCPAVPFLNASRFLCSVTAPVLNSGPQASPPYCSRDFWMFVQELAPALLMLWGMHM